MFMTAIAIIFMQNAQKNILIFGTDSYNLLVISKKIRYLRLVVKKVKESFIVVL